MTWEEFLVKSQLREGIILLAVMACAVMVFALLVWHHVRLKQAEAALKQEVVRMGGVVRIWSGGIWEELPQPAKSKLHRTDAEAIGAVAKKLTDLGISGLEMEQCMVLVQATNSATKQAVAEAFNVLFTPVREGWHVKDGTTREQYLVVFRGLCGITRSEESGNRDI